MADTVTQADNRHRRHHGEWYYAALCVECRVCGAGVGSVCRAKNGGEYFSAHWKHHYWRYRDVRELLGMTLENQAFVDLETWRQERQQRNELVNA